MPPENSVELQNKSGSTTPAESKNNNMNNNNTKEKQAMLLEKLQKSKENATLVKTTSVVVPPDGGWGWVVMMASFFCNIIVDGIVFTAGIFIPEIKKELKGNAASVALVSSLLSGFYLMAGPFVAALANRYGFRPVTIMGSFIAATAFSLCYFAESVLYLHICYGVLGGIGFCFIYMPSVITVGYYFEKWRALATGISLCGSGVGTFLMAPLSKWLIEQLGWKGALLVQAGMILFCSLFACAFRPIEPIQVSLTNDDDFIEKQSIINEHVLFTKPLPEGRFAYSVPNSSHNTWMGAANNTSYPTAAEVFRGSGANLERRPSITSGVLTQVNIHSTTKKLEQFRLAQKRSGHSTPEEGMPHPPPILSNTHHELDAVGEAEEENENGTLLEKNEVKPTTVQGAGGRRHTVSGRKIDSMPNSRRGSRHEVNRPLYRDDIFFSGSLIRIPQYKSQSSIGYHLSVTHLPTKHDIEEEQEKNNKCNLCPEAVTRTLSTMLDMSLLKSPSFVLLAFSGFFTMLGFFVPFIYITDRATHGNMDADTAVFLVSAIGIANTIARIICGVLSSFKGINALHLSNFAITIGGVATMASGMYMTKEWQYSYAAIFGLACACFSALRSIMVVDLMGLEKLTNAFGILMLFQGIAAIIGAPLAGYIYEQTNSYDLPFYVAGGLITFSAILCYPLKYINNWEKQKLAQQKLSTA